MHLTGRPRFLARVFAVVALILGAKVITHLLAFEPISLNALFSGIIAANVFLMGFLLSGVLADYKESERLPGELSACLENMAQEVRGIGITKPRRTSLPALPRSPRWPARSTTGSTRRPTRTRCSAASTT